MSGRHYTTEDLAAVAIRVPAALDGFTRGYVACAYWTTFDDPEAVGPLAADALTTIRAECEAFQEANAGLLASARAEGMDDEQLGHDLWLTRNGHGSGYWSRDLSEEVSRGLTDAAYYAGQRDLYEEGEVVLYFGGK